MKLRTKLIIITLIGLVVGVTGGVLADREDHHEDAHKDDDHTVFKYWLGDAKPVISPVTSNLYAEECGSCHFAYQPGLLPAASWDRMMSNLNDHFGDNAELSKATEDVIRDYLLTHSADRAKAGLAQRIRLSQTGRGSPLRITETRFFLHEHDEIPPKMVQDNDQLGSFSQCDACHTRAAAGSFREHEIHIPGFAQWDD
jgi:hypothetical protein